MSPTEPTKPLSAPDLAHQLFDAAVVQYKGDDAQASMGVINYLREALVYAIVMSAADDASARQLLKHVADSIVGAPGPPPASK